MYGYHALCSNSNFIVLNFVTVSTHFAHNYPITNLYDSLQRELKLTNAILRNYPHVVKLNVAHNREVTDVNHLRKLQKLDASSDIWAYTGNSGITNEGLAKLTDLVILYVNHNEKVRNINHMTKLRILYAGGYCGIGDSGIERLTGLTILESRHNKRITLIAPLRIQPVIYPRKVNSTLYGSAKQPKGPPPTSSISL